MRCRSPASVGVLALLACIAFPFGSAWAEVIRTLRIESTPPGAEVFLLQGSEETRIGTTPFDYKAEFHSEVSILRLAARKPGYDTQQLEVSAGEGQILIQLSSRAFATAPKDIKDPDLRKLQERMNLAIDRIAPQALRHQEPFQVDLAGAISVQRVGKEAYLLVPVVLLNGPEEFREISSSNAESFLIGLWDQLGQAFVIPLARAAKDVKGLDGILVDAEYRRMQRGFNVGAKTETRTYVVLECRGGVRHEVHVDREETVWDPCLTQVPVTHQRTELVADPRVSFKNAQSKARYVAPLSLPTNRSARELYDRIGATLMDDNGKVIAGHGSPPM